MSDELLPVLFVGHGSPMNAIENNRFTKDWERIASLIPKPETILCISAHWYTPDTRVLAVNNPRTIHDFYGFPDDLYQQQYSAQGNESLSARISSLIGAKIDTEWGFDHGTWSVLKRMYPDADIPTLQLSINYNQPARYHYEIMNELRILRQEGVLIIGSGNIVHNLNAVNWNMPEGGYDWNLEFASMMDHFIKARDFTSVVDYQHLGGIAKQSHPTPDHFYPLLYALSVTESSDSITSFAEGYVYGSISMTSYAFGI